MLIGTNTLESTLWIAGMEYQLGDIVRRAFARVAVSEDRWNSLPEAKRDMLIQQEVNLLRQAMHVHRPSGRHGVEIMT